MSGRPAMVVRGVMQTGARLTRAWRALPRLVRELVLNWLIGIALGLGLAVAVLWLNIDNLWTLIRNSADPVPPLVLLCVGFATTFGGVFAAAAAMTAHRGGQ